LASDASVNALFDNKGLGAIGGDTQAKSLEQIVSEKGLAVFGKRRIIDAGFG
jgi:hypothetical protein